jgi:hypothetical protein
LLRLVKGRGSGSTEAEEALEKVGIVYNGGEFVWLNSENISRHLLEKTKFKAKSIGEYFSRLENSTRVRKNNVRFWEVAIEFFLSGDGFQRESEF